MYSKYFVILSWTICVLGLVLQVNEVSISYFKFQSDSRVKVAPHFNIKVPSTSICFRVVDIIQPSKIKSKWRTKIYKFGHRLFNWKKFGNFRMNTSVGELFDYTPGVDEIVFNDEGMHGCMIRFPKKHIMKRFNASMCYKYFTISKYHHREYICYMFTPRSIPDQDTKKYPSLAGVELEIEDYSLKDSFFGLIYHIRLNTTLFAGIKYITNYIHEDSSIPLYDSLLAFMTKIKGHDSYVLTSYSSLLLNRLPPPYDTMCKHYPFKTGQVNEHLNLINSMTIRQLGNVIPDIMIFDGDEKLSKYPVLITEALRNDTISNIYEEITSTETEKSYSCVISSNNAKSVTHPSEDGTLIINVLWPDQFHFDIYHVANSHLIDYIIYVCSSFGFWFGLSVFSLCDSIRQFLYKTSINTPAKERKTRTVENEAENIERLRSQLKRLRRVMEIELHEIKEKLK